MLERVLEPECMDSAQEALDYDSMDHSEVNERFVDDLLAAAKTDGEELAGDVLDLGTGTAQIAVALCRKHASVRVMAIDLSVSMLDLARGNVEVAGLTDRIALDRVDAKQLPYEEGQFQTVMSNSIVHHIPEPQAVLADAWRVTAPGGRLFFRDLLRPHDDAEVTRLVETYAAGCNDHQRKLFDDSLRAALSLVEIQALISAIGGDPAAVKQTTDRHWTWTQKKSS